MAITNKEEGVWGIDKVFAKQNQGSIWEYDGSGALYAWGSNTFGSLGLNQSHGAQVSSPTQIPGVWGQSSQFTGRSGRFMLFKTDGTLWVWGRNTSGTLGLNNTTNYSSPVQVPGTKWKTGGNNEDGAVGLIRTDGTLWMAGSDSNGQLAQSNQTSYSSPKQVPGTTWSEITGGEGFLLATKTDGTLWSWGENNDGQLGQNNKTLRSSPIQIPGSTWTQVCAIRDACYARKTDGTLWAWGTNNGGNLGQNNKTNYSSPRQVGSDTTWANLPIGTESGGGSCMMAIKTDGTLWTWGEPGDYGILGLNEVGNPGSRSSPTQLPGTTWSTTIRPSMSSIGASAMKTDGTAWVWGGNAGDFGGNLGQNSQVNYSSPVQIPGTDWTNIVMSKNGCWGMKAG